MVGGALTHFNPKYARLSASFSCIAATVPAQPMPLALVMRDKGQVWEAIVRKHQLLPHSMEQLIGQSWQFADFALSRTHSTSSILSTIKLRQAGFGDCIDTEDMFRWWFAELQRRRVLPR